MTDFVNFSDGLYIIAEDTIINIPEFKHKIKKIIGYMVQYACIITDEGYLFAYLAEKLQQVNTPRRFDDGFVVGCCTYLKSGTELYLLPWNSFVLIKVDCSAVLSICPPLIITETGTYKGADLAGSFCEVINPAGENLVEYVELGHLVGCPFFLSATGDLYRRNVRVPGRYKHIFNGLYKHILAVDVCGNKWWIDKHGVASPAALDGEVRGSFTCHILTTEHLYKTKEDRVKPVTWYDDAKRVIRYYNSVSSDTLYLSTADNTTAIARKLAFTTDHILAK